MHVIYCIINFLLYHFKLKNKNTGYDISVVDRRYITYECMRNDIYRGHNKIEIQIYKETPIEGEPCKGEMCIGGIGI